MPFQITLDPYQSIHISDLPPGASLTSPHTHHISISCDILDDPVLYRAIFLTSFYGFLRMSNIAPHSAKQFSKHRHFLRQDLIFGHPGAHLIIKWTKTLHDHRAHHIIQLPSLKNTFLCPVRALTELVQSRPLPPDAPLFANNFPQFAQVIDSHIRDSLKKVLIHRNIPLQGHSFHTFRRSVKGQFGQLPSTLIL